VPLGDYASTYPGSRSQATGLKRGLRAGSFIFIPQGVPHGLRVGAVPTRKLNFYPAAMTAYFSDLPAALARSGVTDEDLTEIAEAHHMHIVGPLRSGTSRATPGTVDYD